MHNLIPVLTFKYRDDMKTNFFPYELEATKDNYWNDTLKRVMCTTKIYMAEKEESDAIGLNISLEFSKKYQEELSASSKSNESHPTPNEAMTTDTAVTATRTT